MADHAAGYRGSRATPLRRCYGTVDAADLWLAWLPVLCAVRPRASVQAFACGGWLDVLAFISGNKKGPEAGASDLVIVWLSAANATVHARDFGVNPWGMSSIL